MLRLKEANFDDSQKEYAFVREIPENENGFTNAYFGASYEEFKAVCVIGSRYCKNTEVCRPARSLVSLRTAHGDGEEVIDLSPINVLIQLVYFFVGGVEVSGVEGIK